MEVVCSYYSIIFHLGKCIFYKYLGEYVGVRERWIVYCVCVCVCVCVRERERERKRTVWYEGLPLHNYTPP